MQFAGVVLNHLEANLTSLIRDIGTAVVPTNPAPSVAPAVQISSMPVLLIRVRPTPLQVDDRQCPGFKRPPASARTPGNVFALPRLVLHGLYTAYIKFLFAIVILRSSNNVVGRSCA